MRMGGIDMKIAMMTNNYKPFIGGVPISVERLSQSLRKRGHEVCIFAPEYEDEYWEEDVIRYRSCEKRMKNGMAIPNIPVSYTHLDVYKRQIMKDAAYGL